ncbi:MAG: GLUG motif-containing protein [Acholeplasmataceae bacterium]
MKRKYIIDILLVLLLVFNITTAYAYWANNILGDSSINTATISIGNWSDDEVINDEDTLIEFLSGEMDPDADIVLTSDIDLSENENNTFEPIENFTGTLDGGGNTITGFEIIDEGSNFTGLITNNTGTISNLVVEDITVTQTDNSSSSNSTETAYIGVLIGENNGTVENVQVNSSTITATNNSSSQFFSGSTLNLYAGGIVGFNGANGVISNSYSKANIQMTTTLSSVFVSTTTANLYAGGLVGYNEGVVSYGYATGSITNTVTTSSSWGGGFSLNTYAGGVVGFNNTTGNVHHVFATGNLTISASTGTKYIGYVVARNTGTTSSLYRLNSQTYSPTNATLYNNATSTTVTNLQAQTYLTNNLGFDFVNVWLAQTGNYPILQT